MNQNQNQNQNRRRRGQRSQRAQGNQNQNQQPRRRRNRRRNNQTVQNPAIIQQAQNTGQRIGARIGGAVENIVRSKAATAAASLISRITGMGDYVVNGAVTYNTLAGNTPPTFGSIGGLTRIRNREYIGDVTGSIGFNLTRYPLNPGMRNLFPWLSTLASVFEQYRFHGLVVEFKSTSASALNSVNTALGTVIMGTQYDPSDPAFINKVQIENYEGSQSCKPSDSMLHAVECAPGTSLVEKFFVRVPGQLGDTEDLKFYDLGNISIATAGMQAAAVIGELWVSYDVEFWKPKAPLYGVGSNTLADVYYIGTSNTADTDLSLVPQGTTIFTTKEQAPYHDMIGTRASNQTITFPATAPRGWYWITMTWFKHTSATYTAPTYNNPVSGVNILQWPVGKSALYPGGFYTNAVSFANGPFTYDCLVSLGGTGIGEVTFPCNLGTAQYFDANVTIISVPSNLLQSTLSITQTRMDALESRMMSLLSQLRDNRLMDIKEHKQFRNELDELEEDEPKHIPMSTRKLTVESVEAFEALPEEDAEDIQELITNPDLMKQLKNFMREFRK